MALPTIRVIPLGRKYLRVSSTLANNNNNSDNNNNNNNNKCFPNRVPPTQYSLCYFSDSQKSVCSLVPFTGSKSLTGYSERVVYGILIGREPQLQVEILPGRSGSFVSKIDFWWDLGMNTLAPCTLLTSDRQQLLITWTCPKHLTS